MRFTIFQDSRKGGRRHNQDRVAYCYSRDALLMVVADGMGGHLHGEVAAQLAVQFLVEAFRREAKPRLADPGQFLHRNIMGAHLTLLDYARARRLPDTPRTTCVACVVQSDAIAQWAHVGDSRLYHLREGRILARTRDHSVVQLLVDQGRIREEAVPAHPDRNKIVNCLGAGVAPQVELSPAVPLAPGDVLLLCTDGLWGPLTPRLIGTTLAASELVKAVPELLDLAEQRAGADSDNLSVVAMCWEQAAASAGDVSTVTLPADTVTTQLQDFGRPEQTELSEEEIERAIEEIRAAIRRYAPPKV